MAGGLVAVEMGRAVAFADHRIHNAQLKRIGRAHLHDVCSLGRARAVLEQDARKALWGQHAVDAVLLHPHYVCHAQR